ncbi:hypothetical protein JCM1393_18220 [Clostridium carnis]
MKTDIEIVTGFLGSGKTHFINFLVNHTLLDNEKIIIIQCEKGNKVLNDTIINNPKVQIYYCPDSHGLNDLFIKNILSICEVHRIIIEFNGTSSLNDLLNLLSKKKLKKRCKVTTVFYLADSRTFNIYLNNMINLLLPSIQFSNLILINNTKYISKKELKTIKLKLDSLNPYAFLVDVHELYLMGYIIKKMNILDNGIQKKLRIFIKNLFL